ncbi:MAG TPA: DUF420 domain-containing protein [Nitrospiria bacterium]|nr:DUF420 domain-containing protein [Nitrospiria bacterium]
MKTWLEGPGFLSPYGTMGADLSFVLAVGFTVMFLVGWRKAKQHKGQAHHVVTLWAMLAMIAYFVAYYVNRGLGALAFEGEEGFGGPPELYETVFGPLLTFHILVVTIGLVMAVYMIVLGFRASVKRGEDRTLTVGAPKGSGPAFSGWILLASIVTPLLLFGIRIMFTTPTVGKFIGWMSTGLLVGIGVLVAEAVGRWMYPDGARRHRAIGTFTMVLYVLALLTSTATWVMLYVIWKPTIG